MDRAGVGGDHRARATAQRSPAGVVTVGHVDPFSGASGDLLLAAVVDAGVEAGAVVEMLGGLALEGWELVAEPVTRAGLAATQVSVRTREERVVRTWPNVRELLAQARLPEPVRSRALSAFRRLAEVEAKLHRQQLERVHFHELGALDAIVDVVGVCAGLHLLGARSLSCAPVALGTGMTRTEHGLLPVPAPAVLELLRGAPTMATGETAELCTATGAALLAEWVDHWGPMPSLVIDRVGYGAGGRELRRPGLLRLVVGQPAEGRPPRQALLLEATVDDLPGELVPALLDALRRAGADDAWVRPVHGHRGRPALEVACVADPQHGEGLRRLLFTETTALGVRGRVVDRWTLDLEWATVEVAGQPVRLKIGRLGGSVVNVAPDHGDCAAAAAAAALPLQEVFARARSAWRGEGARPPGPLPA
ncbi:MAG TPA: nickel pincer cofactor biosynthesis protein LarC [Egibacteraceae bacterium]|nr:nickel pincer cofactor biosynthesis protein LarC [Egibacteraceae bacterium]